MIFAFATDDRFLHVFRDEARAISEAECVDVEDGVWLFFAEDGAPLEPVIRAPSKRGRFTVSSGHYSLRRSRAKNGTSLLETLPEVAAVVGELGSIAAVRQVLTSRGTE